SRANRSRRTAVSRPGPESREPSSRTRRSCVPTARARTSAAAIPAASSRGRGSGSWRSAGSSNARSATPSCPRRSRTATERGTPMKASLPRRMTLHAIEAAALTLGYRVKREPFDVVAFRGLYDGKRFHIRLETHGLERVPKGSEIDLHVDFMRDVTAFHGSKAESEEIAFDMAQPL